MDILSGHFLTSSRLMFIVHWSHRFLKISLVSNNTRNNEKRKVGLTFERVEHPKTQQNLLKVETHSHRNRLFRVPCHTRWQWSHGYQGVTWLVQNLLRPKTTNPNPSIPCAPSAIQHSSDTCQVKSHWGYYYSIFCLMLLALESNVKWHQNSVLLFWRDSVMQLDLISFIR